MNGGFDMDDEDLIPVEDVVITMSTSGYIKPVSYTHLFKTKRCRSALSSDLDTEDERV